MMKQKTGSDFSESKIQESRVQKKTFLALKKWVTFCLFFFSSNKYGSKMVLFFVFFIEFCCNRFGWIILSKFGRKNCRLVYCLQVANLGHSKKCSNGFGFSLFGSHNFGLAIITKKYQWFRFCHWHHSFPIVDHQKWHGKFRFWYMNFAFFLANILCFVQRRTSRIQQIRFISRSYEGCPCFWWHPRILDDPQCPEFCESQGFKI